MGPLKIEASSASTYSRYRQMCSCFKKLFFLSPARCDETIQVFRNHIPSAAEMQEQHGLLRVKLRRTKRRGQDHRKRLTGGNQS
jgi:hypothetical protein